MAITAAELVAKISVDGVDVAKSALLSVGGAFDFAAGSVVNFISSSVQMAAEFIKSSVQMAADYQQSMNMVQALTGSSLQQMAQYDAGLKQLAVDAGVAPTELSKGLYYVLSASYAGADAMNVLRLSTYDAKIGMTDQATTANALTTVLKAFSVQAKDFTRVNGEMLQTVTLGKMTMTDYAGSIGKASSTAMQFHVSMENMNASIATMTSNGIPSAHQAVTDFTQAVSVMYANINTVSKSLNKQGIEFNTTTFNMLSYQDKIKMLNTALEEAANKHIKVTGVTKQAAAAIQIISQHMQEYSHDLATLSDKQAMAQKTQEAWAITQQGFNQQMDQAKAAVDVLMISIGNALLPVLGQLFQAVTPTITAFTQWIDKSHLLQDVAKTLSDWIGYIGQGFNDVFNPINKVTAIMKPLTDSFDRATSIIKPLKDVMTPLTDTFDRAKGIIASTSAAVQPMTDSFDRATSIIKPLNTEVAKAPNTWVPFWTAVKNLKDQIMNIDWGAIGKGLSNIGSAIQKMDWGKVGQFFTDLGNNIKNIDWGKVGTSLQNAAIGLTKVDWGKVGQAFAQIATAIIKVDWGKVGDAIAKVSDSLSKVNWGAIMNGIGFVLNAVNQVAGMFNWLYDLLLGHSIIPDLINGIVKWFTDLGPRALGAINTFIGNVGSAFQGMINSALGWGSSLINNIVTGIQNASGNIHSTLHNLGIPGFASGTSSAPGGMAVVGERGPELMYVPRGAQIIPNNQISQVSSGGQSSSSSSGSNTPIILQLDGYIIARALMPHITDQVRYGVGGVN